MTRLKRFPLRKLKAKTGTIRGFLFENEHIRLPRTLFHEIRVPLEAFDLASAHGDKERVKTELQLDFIQLPDHPFRGYAPLVGRALEFPINPADGYIDASVYVSNVHNALDVTQLSFLALRRGVLEVSMTLSIDFESEQTGFANTDVLCVDVLLRPKPALIYDDIVKKAKRKDPRALLAPFVDEALLGDVVTEENRVTVRINEIK